MQCFEGIFKTKCRFRRKCMHIKLTFSCFSNYQGGKRLYRYIDQLIGWNLYLVIQFLLWVFFFLEKLTKWTSRYNSRCWQLSINTWGPGYLLDHLSPIIFSCPTGSDKIGLLQVPSIKQHHTWHRTKMVRESIAIVWSLYFFLCLVCFIILLSSFLIMMFLTSCFSFQNFEVLYWLLTNF